VPLLGYSKELELMPLHFAGRITLSSNDSSGLLLKDIVIS